MTYSEICAAVAKLKVKYDETDPFRLCRAMGITLLLQPMGKHETAIKGFFMECKRIKTITVNSDLPEIIQKIIVAHELGHGYHDFMVQDNAILNQDYSMPVAESASTFNENVIMHKALENCDDKMVKLNLLDSDISGNCQLMCDIYSRFLFESEVCERRVNEFLSADELKKIMLNAQKKAYGDGLDSDCLHPYMWLCKGHYYNAGYNFYNFPYAFGGLFSRGLYEMYVKEGPAFLDKYNEMLRLTPVKSVEDAAMVAGIDVTKPDFYRDTLEAMSKDIDMFIELCESV